MPIHGRALAPQTSPTAHHEKQQKIRPWLHWQLEQLVREIALSPKTTTPFAPVSNETATEFFMHLHFVDWPVKRRCLFSPTTTNELASHMH
jgi:hypothetical protein